VDVQAARPCFNGSALVRVRATVAHDSYERLVEIACSDKEHRGALERSALKPIAKTIQDPTTLGVDIEKLSSAAALDDAIAEFSRFYLERREQETKSAKARPSIRPSLDSARNPANPRLPPASRGAR
jgi:hypothetical protein